MSLARATANLAPRTRPLARLCSALLASSALRLSAAAAPALTHPVALPAFVAGARRARSLSLRSGPDTPHRAPATPVTGAISVREVGKRGTNEWRMQFTRDGKDISPWHDIPLLADGSTARQLLFNYINEIPKESVAQ